VAQVGPVTCRICASHAKYSHTEREHEVAEAWIPDFLSYIKTDAFSGTDRPLTFTSAAEKFSLGTSVRRTGGVLDAVEWILRGQGWPDEACCGVTAYVVNASSREPGAGWKDLWKVEPGQARAAARAFVREAALAD
jgi:hypothetical protein